jgi:ribosomal-protein-alanine N-acetyltransferase
LFKPELRMSAVLRPDASLQPMSEDDLDEVLEIERGIYEFPWTWGNFSDSMNAGYSCWVYREADVLIGYCIIMAMADEAHLLNLSVSAKHHRQGYGRMLLEHVIAVARQHSARSLFLEVRPGNTAARELYAANGFGQIGTRRDYYPARDGREDALVLAIDLAVDKRPGTA